MNFDKSWYEKTYEDVAKSGIDSFTHYSHFGIYEGRFSDLSKVPNELKENGLISDQIKFLKSKISDSELNSMTENRLHTFSRFQLPPKVQLNNPLFEVFVFLKDLISTQRKSQILLTEVKNYEYLKHLFWSKKSIFLVFREENNFLREIELTFKQSSKIFKFSYPFNNTDNVIFQLLNLIIYNKIRQKDQLREVKYLNFMKKYSNQVKIFQNLYKRNSR